MDDEEIIDYETLVAEFEKNLLDKLRKHSLSIDFLELWVPDADLVKSVGGIFDAAQLAGKSKIAIKLGPRTTSKLNMEELFERLDGFDLTINQGSGPDKILRAQNLEITGASIPSFGQQKARRPGKVWHPSQTLLSDSGPTVEGARTETKKFEIAFKGPILERSKNLKFQYPQNKLSECEKVSGKINGGCLALNVDSKTHIIHACSHIDVASLEMRVILDVFCEKIEGVPIQDAADHGGLRAIEALRDETKPRPAEGIVLPFNIHPYFQNAIDLVRELRSEYIRRVGDTGEEINYSPPPSENWQDMNKASRCRLLEQGVAEFLSMQIKINQEIQLFDLLEDKLGFPLRAVIVFGDGVPVRHKPGLLRELEKHLRRTVEAGIEVISEKATDESPLRRLV